MYATQITDIKQFFVKKTPALSYFSWLLILNMHLETHDNWCKKVLMNSRLRTKAYKHTDYTCRAEQKAMELREFAKTEIQGKLANEFGQRPQAWFDLP